MLARLCVAASLSVCSVVAVAGPAEAGTISAGGCLDAGGTIVDHGAWQGCRGIAPHDIKIV